MAKVKGAKRGMSEMAMWSITILTLAICCAVMAMLINENRDLQASNEQLAAVGAAL